MSIDAVIFDCDGTLVDSEPINIAALCDEAAVHGIAIGPAEAEVLFKGVKMAVCVQHIEARSLRRLPDDFVSSVRHRMAGYFQERLTCMPDAREALTELALPYCVASNGSQERTRMTLALCGLLPILKGPIFSAYDINHWKPEPDLFLHAAQAMGVSPARCAVVEDSEPGMRAGVAAGMKVFAVVPEEAVPPDLLSHVEQIGSLRRLIERLAPPSAS